MHFFVWVIIACCIFCHEFSHGRGTQTGAPAVWAETDKLIAEQKYQAALDKTTEILERARDDARIETWTQALIKSTQLQLGLHGYETSVRFLTTQTWPKDPASRVLLHLYYGFALMQYHNMYGWEIGQREKTVSTEKVDLKAWTTEQVGQEIGRAFDQAMAEAPALGSPLPGYFQPYFQKNNFPKGVRPTLRDAVVYLAAEHLSNSVYWSAKASHEIYKLNIARLASAPAGRRLPAADVEIHPLEKLASWLGEHKAFHAKAARGEAALEAHYELLSRLHSAVSETADKDLIRKALRDLQSKSSALPWWARGQALLADFIQAEARPGGLIEAREVALKGAAAFPGTVGAQFCTSIVAQIERPAYDLSTMANDGIGRASILLNYKNLEKIHLRAYPLDLDARLKEKRGGQFMNHDRLRDLVDNATTKPAADWSEPLSKTPDFAYHRAFITPKLNKPGTYFVVASARPDFLGGDNQVSVVQLTLTDLVLFNGLTADGNMEARVLSGESGKPVAAAGVDLYRFQWERIPEKSGTYVTDQNGYATVKAPPTTKEYWNYFLFARKDANRVVRTDGIYFHKPGAPTGASSTLVFTDRSIYRPQQRVLWKVVAYTGHPVTGKFQTAPKGTSIPVQLFDPNGEVVAKISVKTNGFGTAAGEFLIPSGRPLGLWRLVANNGGSGAGHIRVEEYKRPTFETNIKDSGVPLRLNQKAKLIGEAKYYFGLPLSSGKVSWRITREEVIPWWWSYWGRGWFMPNRMVKPQTVASGISPINANGLYEIEFTPEADQRLAKKDGLSFNFAISADVTDDGGETRTANRSIRLGFVTVEANLYWDSGFFLAGAPITIASRRSSLSGEGRKGKGAYRIVRLIQPAEASLPADLPRQPGQGRDDSAADLERFATPGDQRRARWDTAFDWQTVSRSWKEGREVARGTIEHDVDGKGEFSLSKLADPGTYRIFYETKDDFDASFKLSRDFLVLSSQAKIALPFFFELERANVQPGETARFYLYSGLPNQILTIDTYRGGKRLSRREFTVGRDPSLFEVPVTMDDRGGFTLVAYGVRDHQIFSKEISVQVPWDDRRLDLSFSTFRDQLRPSARENFRITVKDNKGQPLSAGAAELLAYMYDRSLNLFTGHSYPSPLQVYPSRTGAPRLASTVQQNGGYGLFGAFATGPSRPSLWADRLNYFASYGIGGPGHRGGPSALGTAEAGIMGKSAEVAMPASRALREDSKSEKRKDSAVNEVDKSSELPRRSNEPAVGTEIRTNFAETAFFLPNLILGDGGSVSFEFTVPDSVTSWNVYAHALTRDMRGGSIMKETKSVKELMVRPYVPRFLREGDTAEIKVAVNNASDAEMSGELTFDIEDTDTGKSILAEFGLTPANAKKKFTAPKTGAATLSFPIRAPRRVGLFAFRIVAKSKRFSDGELRPFPVLPSRMHLAQSRFVTLRSKDSKTMEFKDLAAGGDATLLNEKLVVTVDAQLFYGVLQSLPYLIKYPYECSEQTLNRFLATGIVSSVFHKYPAVAKMAKEFSSRKSRLEKFDEPDPNRRMTLEESPWLPSARGGKLDESDLVNVLDRRVAAGERDRALTQIRKLQLPSGAWPWFPNGPPDSYMSLYMLMGFARALEFKVDVPKDMAVKGWGYVRDWLDGNLQTMMGLSCCWETITFVNFVLGSYPDTSWTGGRFDEAYRKVLLDYSFSHWKNHSPLLKGYLALTLKRMNRAADAKLVWDSVMDSAKHDVELGTYWSPEDRSWLWYNDTIETHAFSLRTEMELDPTNKHNDGLVQWLFLNKKLNHWKSTKATAEAIYSLVHFLDKTSALGAREAITINTGGQKTEFVFAPDKYTGKKNQIVIPGDKINPATNSKIIVEKLTPGFAFASATWHFSTDILPKEERGDFFAISRRYFRRELSGGQWTLRPLTEDQGISVGDQIEVQISLKTKHEAEYVHLRDPRAAGMEPESLLSGYKWDLGIYWYEETRDSGANFFFSKLPVGEYTFKYRLRANMSGTFRVGPATIQSMYAPEFNAYSKGDTLVIR